MLAHSLHELARILGAGHTSSDLLPVFEEYCTKDVDDVKVGVLAHLAEFFEVRDTYEHDIMWVNGSVLTLILWYIHFKI